MSATIIETDGNTIVLDLSTDAALCGRKIAGLDTTTLGGLIDQAMSEAGTAFAFGRWAEPRALYDNDNFAGVNGARRTVHMGIDLFCVAGTPVCTPLAGVIEYVANNDRALDYGPMLILRHEDDTGEIFFTLYGHLSLDTVDRVAAGEQVRAGQRVAAVGAPPYNGNWPPHLHFQVIRDLIGLGTSFPGVAATSEQAYWLKLSPSPAQYFPECDAQQLEFSSCS